MAGIGFELRKMFSESDSTFGDIKAIAYSTIISVGPWIITAVSLNILLYIAKGYIILRSERVIFMSTVLYAFIFSQVIASPWQYMVTRYVSDCIYKGQTNQLKGAFIGVMKVVLIISFVVAKIFFKSSPLSLIYKSVSTLLFTLLSGSWICISFVSIVKNYSFVAYSYIAGNILAVILGALLGRIPIEFTKNILPINLLLAYTLGILLTFLMLSYHLLSSFEEVGPEEGEEKNEFAFLKYLKGYISLFLIGFFYTTGTWVHLFVTWFKGDFYIISGTFRTASFYEVALFYAFLITIPSMVYFIVFLETKFFPDYKKYYAYLSYKGTLDNIETSKLNMMDTLGKELYYCMELQLFISLSLALTANIFFNYYELDLYLLELFRIFIFSAYCVIVTSILITILLYLDARKEALFVSAMFMSLNFLFTYILAPYGEEYTGLGFFLASFLSLLIAREILFKTFNKLTYTTFYHQNFEKHVGSPLLTIIEKFFNRRGYILVVIVLLLAGLFSSCTHYNEQGFNNVTRRNWHTMSVYDLEGYTSLGYNSEGINRRGFDREGFNSFTKTEYDFFGFDVNEVHNVTNSNVDERGFDREGYFLKGDAFSTVYKYDEKGFDRLGLHKDTGTEYDNSGWTYYGLNQETQDYFDSSGYSVTGYDNQGFDKEGYDLEGYNNLNWNREGINRFTKTGVDNRGFDKDGYYVKNFSYYDERGFDYLGQYLGKSTYDKKGFDVNAIHKNTNTIYNPDGWSYYGLNIDTKTPYDKKGFSIDGYNINGYDKKGFDRDGYNFEGYDNRNYDREGYNRKGWNNKGQNKFTGTYYDFYGFKKNGIHYKTKSKYNEYGWDRNGINKETKGKYDKEGYNINGLNRNGKARVFIDIDSDSNLYINYNEWDSSGLNSKTKTRFDKSGYDINGIDKDGFNKEGIYIEN